MANKSGGAYNWGGIRREDASRPAATRVAGQPRNADNPLANGHHKPTVDADDSPGSSVDQGKIDAQRMASDKANLGKLGTPGSGY